MKRKYLIFVPDLFSNEYSEIINWGFDNLSSLNVMVLDELEVYKIQYQTPIFDIINEENDSMIQLGEDDWVENPKVINNILLKLNSYVHTVSDSDILAKVKKIIFLFETAINFNRGVYFFL